MEEERLVTVVVKRETILQSIICDTYSFAILGALFWFNYNFVGGSYFVNFLIILLCILKIMATSNSSKVKIFRKVSDKKINKILKLIKE